MKHNLLIVVLVLFAFVGQAVSSTAVPCRDMKNMDMSESMMNHSMESNTMNSSEMDSGDTVAFDCCQQDCNCPMGLSVSATLSSIDIVYNVIIPAQKIESYFNLLLRQSLTSLYRPPIY